ncbi:MAG: hypothetical protein NUW37_16550 [Planctomycetes bacterium]|nr:hypothetical protein [Planctomycetota bacterium]
MFGYEFTRGNGIDGKIMVENSTILSTVLNVFAPPPVDATLSIITVSIPR